ncbi:MAG: hypothetical protein LBJ36_10935 [Synergistaceae bacterium]|jgi:putative transposase|nr:hypothetical protein [Synergistaceae bacterium]
MKAMQHVWGRKISDLVHAQFLGILSWEMHKNGNHGTKIDRFYPSSKPVRPVLMFFLSCRCPSVEGRVRDAGRDIAAVNILRVGTFTFSGGIHF